MGSPLVSMGDGVSIGVYGAGVSIGVYGVPDWGLWGPTLRSIGLGISIGIYGFSTGVFGVPL